VSVTKGTKGKLFVCVVVPPGFWAISKELKSGQSGFRNFLGDFARMSEAAITATPAVVPKTIADYRRPAVDCDSKVRTC
jgi:hypothetical protein